MIDKLKEIVKRNKVIIQNFSYLSSLQVFNMILPLITYPYLIRVLGTEVYGVIVYAQAIIAYFVLLVGFGFNITATKEVSINRYDIKKLSEIVSSIFIIKGVLFLIAFTILSILLSIIPIANNYTALFYLTMWVCLYELIFPIFYFQGVEKMKYITYITLVSRLIFLILIFILVKGKLDYLYVPLINGIGALISGVISIRIMTKDGLKFKLQSSVVLFSYIKKSYVMALANASNTFKSNFNLIVIKFLFSYKEVAYFDLAMKISNLGVTFLDIISQTIFPKMSREKNSNFLKKIIKLSVGLSVLFVLFIQVFSNLIVQFLGGESMSPTSQILRIIIFFVPIYIVGAMFGRNCLIIHGYDRQVLKSMLYSSLVYLMLLALLYYSKIEITIIILTFIYVFSYAFDTFYRYIICKLKNIY